MFPNRRADLKRMFFTRTGEQSSSPVDLVLKHVGRAVPNVPLLGGFAAISSVIALDAVISAIRDKFSGKVADGNIAAATGAYEAVAQQTKESAHA